MPSSQKILLELRSIGKSFPGTRALDSIDLQVRQGQVVCLLGENGAGKSTLMKILSGVWPVGEFEGEIFLLSDENGTLKKAEFSDTRSAIEAGVAMIHQELAVFPELTVGEHLELDRLSHWINWTELHLRVQSFLDLLQLGLRSETPVRELSVGGQQLVEIARALYRNAQVLIFDEPTSALTEQEVQKLYRLVAQLKAQGKGIIYITHRMDEVFHLADQMVVMRDGRNAGGCTAWSEQGERIPRSQLEPQLISWMVGRPLSDVYPPLNDLAAMPEVLRTVEILKVEKLSLTHPSGKRLIRDLSVTVRPGEVVGLAGLLGAGRSETFDALFGVLSGKGPRGPGYLVKGNVWIKGKRKDLDTPRQAMDCRMALVSEDRKGNGLVLGQSVLHNASLPALVTHRGGLTSSASLFSSVSREMELRSVEHWSKELRLKATHLDQLVGELSGGNQQKVVLTKWLLTEPEILFLDEPTRGIDIGAKVEIYGWIQRLAAQGMGIVLASSEMPELLGLCHRILVLREGQVTAEFTAGEVTQEDIMRAASL